MIPNATALQPFRWIIVWMILGMPLSVLDTSPLSAQTDAPVGVIMGTIVSMNGDELEPIANAVVSANHAARVWQRMTNRAGQFQFEGLSEGTYTLRVARVGYQPAEIDVVLSGGRTISVEVVLTIQPIALSGVEVESGDRSALNPADPDALAPSLSGAEGGMVGLEALEAGSGMAASGLGRVLSGVPGNDPGDPTDVLFMRGSSMDMKLILLDGAPLYTPFHVSGLLPAFDPAFLTSAKLHNGAAPPEYDGGLAHVLDLRTRPAHGGRATVEGSADLLSARLGARLPLGDRSGVAFGTRGLHRAGEGILGSGFPYGYADIVARADIGLAEDHHVEAMGFLNDESVALDFGSVLDERGTRAGVPVFPSRARWGNTAMSVGYQGRVDRTRVSLRGAYSAYDAELPIRSTLPVFATGRTERGRLAADVRRTIDGGYVRAGVSSDVIELKYSARRLATDSVPGVADVTSAGRGTVVAAFADGAFEVSPTVSVRGGARLARYLGQGVRLAPYASVTWLFGEQAALTIRAGRSDQLTTESDAGVADALGVEALEDPNVEAALIPPPVSLLSVATASHVVVALDQFVSARTRLGLEGWLRRYSGLGSRQPSELNASGIDLRIARSGPTVEGWFGYSLSWYWSPAVGAPEPFRGRQLLSAGLMGRIAGSGRASVQLSYGDGLPFTAVSIRDALSAPEFAGDDPIVQRTELEFDAVTEQSRGNPPLVGGPSGNFLRLDGEVSWTLRQTWGSRSFELSPYVRLLNALNRRDAMFYYFEAWRDEAARPLAELSVMPIVGLSWRF